MKDKDPDRIKGLRILMVDNYDSFTYNLVQFLGILGADLQVLRNDNARLRDVERLEPRGIVISPGPKAPRDAGLSKEIILKFGGVVPILGVCLGHQCIGEAFGGRVVRAPYVMHGKTSLVYHDGQSIFKGIPNPFQAARYHSLVVEEEGLPSCLTVTARTGDGIIMGLRHRELPVEGIQFHPESFMTPQGLEMLRNFLCLCADWPAAPSRGRRREGATLRGAASAGAGRIMM